MSFKGTEDTRVIKINNKWIMLISITTSILIFGFFAMREYSRGSNKGLLYFLCFIFLYIILEIFAYWALNKTQITVNHDSFTTIYPFKTKTLYFDNIAKIESKGFGNSSYMCFYEQFQKKYSTSVAPQRFARDDIKYLLNRILEKRPDVQLDKKTQSYLKK